MIDSHYRVEHKLEDTEFLELNYAPHDVEEEQVGICVKSGGTSVTLSLSWDEWSEIVDRFAEIAGVADGGAS